MMLLLTCGLTPYDVLASEDIGLARARANVCLSCHQIDKKRVGPSFAAIAERYGHVEGADTYLAITIKQGGRGRWGAVPMPAQPQVSDEDAKLIAQWILTMAKPKPEPESTVP